MKLKSVYLILAIFGAVIPLSYFLSYVVESGFDIYLMVDAMFESGLASYFGWNVVLTFFTLIAFVLTEGMRLGMKNRWIYIVMGIFIGVSLALPAFLYARESRLESLQIKRSR
ncbi:MAG: DUF2834 domain-containing protein [Saprospiraceae bacterium]|nr:DUF2834 domain-containing protein [Saprospiraceae bacterium]